MQILSADIHPMRYMRTRPFARQAMQLYRRRIGRRCPTGDDLSAVCDLITKQYNEAIMHVPREGRPARPTRLLVEEASLAMHVGAFTEWGRNIFLLASDTISLLDRTDLKGVRSVDVQLPFSAFYLGFGAAFDASLPGPPNRIDGAYVVELDAGKLQIIITSRRLDARVDRATGWPFTRDLYYYCPLDRSNPGATLDELVEAAVATGEIKIECEAIAPPPPERVELDGQTILVHSVQHETAQEHALFMREGLDAFRASLGLIVNAICLLTSAPEDVGCQGYPSDAPPTIVANALGVERRKRERANAELLDKGFIPIRLIASDPDQARRAGTLADSSTDREIETHWRRGHWRRQPVGPARSSIRLTWIRPTLVRADKGDPASGHIYNVAP